MRKRHLPLMMFLLSGCSNNTEPPGNTDTPSDTVQTLPSNAPIIDGQPECQAIQDAETLASVSPQGFAWLTTQQDQQTTIRVLDPLNFNAPNTHQLELSALTSIQAWSSTDASLIADNTLWRLDDFARINISLQTLPTPSSSLCGELIEDGAVLSNNTIIERRQTQWWTSTLNTQQPPSTLLTQQGECTGPDGAIWATNANGTLWRIQAGKATQHAQFNNLVGAATSANTIMAIDGSMLWSGLQNPSTQWVAWDLKDKNPTQVTSDGQSIWIQTTGELWRWQEDKWMRLPLPDGEQPTTIRAYDNGIWWTTATTICHQATGSGVRLSGVRPFEKTRASSITFQAALYDGQQGLEITHNETALTPQPAGLDTWQVTVPLDNVGWHHVQLKTERGTRDLHIERLAPVELSWEEDIQPIYQIHCSECHQGPNALSSDLSTHELWVKEAERIKTFVVDAQTMPPLASRKDAWNADLVTAISQWIEGSQNK